MNTSIYMDLCCFNRPFDEQSQTIVHLETEAKLSLQERIIRQTIDLVWSFMLTYENHANPNSAIRESIALWQGYAVTTVRPHPTIYATAQELMTTYRIDQKDAIHCACAIFAECDIFLTVDKKLLKNIKQDSRLKTLNPLDFLLLSEERHEN